MQDHKEYKISLQPGKNIFLAILFIVAFTAVTYFIWGLYMDDFEVITHQIMTDIKALNTRTIYATNENFLLYAPKAWLQEIFPSISIHGVTMLLSLIAGYAACFYYILINNPRFAGIFTIVLLYILSLDSFILINNSKVAVLLTLTAISIFCFNKNGNRKHTFLAYILILIAIFSRIEYPLICLFCALICALIFQNKPLLKHSFIAFIIGTVVFLAFVYLVHLNIDGIKDFRDYEKWIDDRMSFTLGGNSIITDSLSRYESLVYAKGLFLLDQPALDEIQYSDIVLHHSLIDYIFKNDNFLKIFRIKFLASFQTIQNTFFPLLIAFIYTWLLVFYKAWSKKVLWKAVLIAGIYLSIFIGVGIISKTHERFISSYLIAPIFIMLVLSAQKDFIKTKNLRHFSLLIYSILAFCYIAYTVPRQVEKKIQLENRAIELFSAFEADIHQGKEPVVGYLDYNGVIPSGLFKTYPHIKWIFLDCGTLNHHPHFRTLNERYFGKNYLSLPARMTQICNDNGEIYTNANTMLFYQKYLRAVHNYELKYELIESFGDGTYNKYSIKDSIL